MIILFPSWVQRIAFAAFSSWAVIGSLAHEARGQAVWEFPPLSATPAGSNGWLATIPFAEDNNAFFIVLPAGVGGIRAWWVVDTGTGRCQIDASLVSRLKHHPRERLRVDLAKGISVMCDSANIQDLRGATSDFGRRVGGVLGYQLFARYVVQIDYAAHALRLYDPKVYRYAGRGDTIVLTFDGKHPRVPVRIADGGVEIARAPFLVTGSADAVNDSLVLNSHTLPRYEVTTSVVGSDSGAAQKALEGTFESVRLGRFSLTNIPSTGDGPGLVGGAFLRQFTCIVDYPHHRMFVEPNEHFGEVFDRGPRSGLTFLASSEHPEPTVTFVIPGSPAAIAGIRAGDVIHELDHQLSRELGVNRVERLLNRAGNSYQLVIQRGNRSLSIHLRV